MCGRWVGAVKGPQRRAHLSSYVRKWQHPAVGTCYALSQHQGLQGLSL